ncbi:F-box only protein 34 [Alosa pseudoharengus]|uniref:F-box only protein 34 n=1 Tax=Alosa pseudoharengus TaxID=34774 RepID=UPI003F8BC092
MPQKCESISYFSPAPYQDPRKPSCKAQLDWRLASMHLKPYPNPQKKESVVEGPCGLHVDQQGALKPEWGLRAPCPLVPSSGGGSASRCPLGVLSTNTLHCSSSSANTNNNTNNTNNTNTTNNNNNNNKLSSSWAARKGKGNPPVPAKVALTSSLLLLASPAGLENEASLRIYQSEDGDGPLDIWAVIKPGNTKEKIAIFAGRQRGRSNDVGGSGGVVDVAPVGEGGQQDTRVTCSMKSKGCWGEGGSLAKRRRLGKTDKTKSPDIQRPQNPGRPPPPVPLCETPAHSAGDSEEGLPQVEGDEGGRMVSVVEMVALLEQLANGDQHMDSKPVSRNSSTVTLPKSPPPIPEPKAVESVEGQEESESVRVLDMVARLESECLKRRSSRESGELSRNNSLRRNVARVLLAGSEPHQAPTQPESPADRQVDNPHLVEGPSVEGNNQPKSQSESLTSPSPCEPPVVVERVDKTGEAQLAPVESRVLDTRKRAEKDLDRLQFPAPELPGTIEVEEPMPGMLFFRQSPPQPLSERKTPHHTETRTHPKICATVDATIPLKPRDSTQFGGSSRISKAPQSPALAGKAQTLHTGVDNDCSDHVTGGEGIGCHGDDDGEEDGDSTGREAATFPLRRQVSHEFLEMRFKIQQLLEPQPYLAVLPHHVLVQIFSLLPTQALAALKCTCRYFRSVIESYDVRPTDSRWVSEPRYRDDPCKQCKRHYRRGDVSLCRWHHKPYCQAMPYGPGYWMCCRGAHKDAPGCNVGLHDNRWVPTFHRMNMPIYKNREGDDEA